MEKKRNHGKIRARTANRRGLLVLATSFLLLSLFLSSPAGAATLASTGDWLQTIGASDLISGAGSGLIDTYLSPADTTILDITCDNPTEEWWITVKRVDQGWDDRVLLSVRVTSEGTGEGSITYEDSFIPVTTGETNFFGGQGDRAGIAIQYQLQGVSLQIPPGNYSTSVEFTLVTSTP